MRTKYVPYEKVDIPTDMKSHLHNVCKDAQAKPESAFTFGNCICICAIAVMFLAWLFRW